MSIDANVVGIVLTHTGAARLTLEQSDPSRCAGQQVLTVDYPPPNVGVLLGRHVWGGDSQLMVGEIEVGRRRGYTGVVLDEEALRRLPAIQE